MGVPECRNDCGRLGFGWLDLGHTLDVDEASIDAVSAAKEGVNAVSCVDFIGRNDVLCEPLDNSSIWEGSGCSEGVHRAGPPTFLV